MIAGALLQATAYTRVHMIVARVVSGVGMGFINSTVPVFQSEFSPKATRGLCTSFSPPPITRPDKLWTRCLHATLNSQPRDLPGILDRLWFYSNLHFLLRLARSLYPTMHLPRPHAFHPLNRSRISALARITLPPRRLTSGPPTTPQTPHVITTYRESTHRYPTNLRLRSISWCRKMV